jgi:hypothetical protein
MAKQLCGSNSCEHCCNICARGGRCSNVCFGEPCQRPVVHTLPSAMDERVPQPPAERYDLPGAPGKQLVVKDFGLGADNDSDEVEPLSDCMPSSGGVLLNLGQRKDILTLAHVHNQHHVQRVGQMSENYSHWRDIRGDGNCYYRSVIFGALEAGIRGDGGGLARLVDRLSKVEYELPQDLAAHDQMLSRLMKCRGPSQL